MKIVKSAMLVLSIGTYATLASADAPVAKAPNGIELPAGFQDWRLISVSHRTDKNHMRAILGNDIAVTAARSGHTNPWPDGSIMAKLAWKDTTDKHWPAATDPGDFVQVEFMIKDAAKYAKTGGWGFARWLGTDLKPYGKDANFVQECFGCHTPVKDQDYVFTHPATLPK